MRPNMSARRTWPSLTYTCTSHEKKKHVRIVLLWSIRSRHATPCSSLQRMHVLHVWELQLRGECPHLACGPHPSYGSIPTVIRDIMTKRWYTSLMHKWIPWREQQPAQTVSEQRPQFGLREYVKEMLEISKQQNKSQKNTVQESEKDKSKAHVPWGINSATMVRRRDRLREEDVGSVSWRRRHA